MKQPRIENKPCDRSTSIMIDAWQKILLNMVQGNGVDPRIATSTMLAVAAFYRGEAVGADRASVELRQYASDHADEHVAEMAALRAEAEGASKH